VNEPAGVVYPDDRRFFAPASMVRELRGALVETASPIGMIRPGWRKWCWTRSLSAMLRVVAAIEG